MSFSLFRHFTTCTMTSHSGASIDMQSPCQVQNRSFVSGSLGGHLSLSILKHQWSLSKLTLVTMTDGDFQGGPKSYPQGGHQTASSLQPHPSTHTGCRCRAGQSTPRAWPHPLPFPFSPTPLPPPPFNQDSLHIDLGRTGSPHSYSPSFGIAAPARARACHPRRFSPPFSAEGWLLQSSKHRAVGEAAGMACFPTSPSFFTQFLSH